MAVGENKVNSHYREDNGFLIIERDYPAKVKLSEAVKPELKFIDAITRFNRCVQMIAMTSSGNYDGLYAQTIRYLKHDLVDIPEGSWDKVKEDDQICVQSVLDNNPEAKPFCGMISLDTNHIFS